MNKPNYWIAVISKEHAMRGVHGGFIQVCHGKQAPLKRMKQGDWVIVYSSKISMEGAERCQAFTAIGQVRDDLIYPFNMSETFTPFRRNINFYPCQETPILPLVDKLEFIPNKKSWGFPFRFGFFEIKEPDFNLIMSKLLPDEINR